MHLRYRTDRAGDTERLSLVFSDLEVEYRVGTTYEVDITQMPAPILDAALRGRIAVVLKALQHEIEMVASSHTARLLLDVDLRLEGSGEDNDEKT